MTAPWSTVNFLSTCLYPGSSQSIQGTADHGTQGTSGSPPVPVVREQLPTLLCLGCSHDTKARLNGENRGCSTKLERSLLPNSSQNTYQVPVYVKHNCSSDSLKNLSHITRFFCSPSPTKYFPLTRKAENLTTVSCSYP